MPSIRPLAGLLLSLTLCTSAGAQQSDHFGEFIVHYNAIKSSLLAPEVARSYGIQRAASQALLSVTVLRQTDNQAISAQVTASAINLNGQRRDIAMRPVSDQDAIYYIGQFRVHNEEVLDFNVQVVPEAHSGPPLEVTFRQQFFTD